MPFEYIGGIVTSGSDPETTISATVDDVAAGDLVVACADHQSGAGTISVSDGTSIFTQDPGGIQHNPGAAGDPHSCMFYLLASVASGSVTYTATFDGPKQYRNLRVMVFRPSAPCSFEDSAANAADSGTNLDSGDITTVGDDGVMLGANAEYGQAMSNLYLDGVNINQPEDFVVNIRSYMWKMPYSAGFTGSASAETSTSSRWNCHAIAFKIGVDEPESSPIPVLHQHYAQMRN